MVEIGRHAGKFRMAVVIRWLQPAPRDRRLPQARARLCGSSRRRVVRDGAVPQGSGVRTDMSWGKRMPGYDQNNIFAKILRGELPCHKVYEDDKALAFLDIMPRTGGHTLVLPKAPARNLLDVAPADLAHVMQVAQRIARAQMKVFDADGIT